MRAITLLAFLVSSPSFAEPRAKTLCANPATLLTEANACIDNALYQASGEKCAALLADTVQNPKLAARKSLAAA
ncbi:MAG: hypothetical protein ACXWSD_16955, partial [Bdellovibrionota bacterium]